MGHESDVRSSASSSEVLSLRRVDWSGSVVDVRRAPDVFARVTALMTVRFEFKFKVREGEGVAGMGDGDSVLWEAERAADEEEAVAVSEKTRERETEKSVGNGQNGDWEPEGAR